MQTQYSSNCLLFKLSVTTTRLSVVESTESTSVERWGGGGGWWSGYIYISEDHDPISQSHNPQYITALFSGKVYFKMTLTTIAPGPAGDDQR